MHQVFSFFFFLSYNQTNESMDRRPRLIKDAFPGMNGKVDAAFQHKSESFFLNKLALNDPGSLRVMGLRVVRQKEALLQAPHSPEADP